MTDPVNQQDSRGLRWAVARTLEIRRREGISGLLFRVLAATGYRRNAWFVRPLGEPIQPVRAGVPIVLCELTVADVDEYVAFRRGAKRGDFLVRLERGFCCHAATCDGQIASVIWTSTGSGYIEFLDRTFSLEPGEVYLFDSFTAPVHRGRRIQAVICAQVLEQFRDKGYHVAFSLIVPENHSSIASRTRSGFRRTGTMGRIKLGRLTRHFFTGQRTIRTQSDPSST